MPRPFVFLVPLLIGLSLSPILASAQVATPVATPAATPIVDVIELPAPTGPYGVGRTSFDWVDLARDEPFSEELADRRELAVWVWYPAETAPATAAADYLPGQWGEAVGAVLGFDPDRVRPHAVADAPLAAAADAYPVLIFSPGSGFFIGAYTALAEDLASHGYVVVGVNHTYNAAVSVFADGRVVPASPAAQPMPPTGEGDEPMGDAMTAVHAADLRFAVDQLERLNGEPGAFQGRLDLSRLGMLGHSLGGAAAAEACRVDRRCDAAANLDGALWGGAAALGVPLPFLLLSASQLSCDEVAASGQVSVEQCETLMEQSMIGWERVRRTAEPGYWLEIQGSGHASYSDAPFLPIAPEVAGPLLAGATIQPERAWRVASDYLLAFFDQSLNGSPAPLLDGPSPEYPEVRFVED